MENYLYSTYEIAWIVQLHGIDIVCMTELLQQIYYYDNAFIKSEYRHNQKKFFLDVMDSLNYINAHEQFNIEKTAIDQDMADFGLLNIIPNDDSNEKIAHLIFKELRMRIQYINNRGYARMKLRTLLSELGYKKRSPNVINYIIDCLLFYHISVSLRDNVPCDIEKIGLDEMITFRII